MRSRYVELSQQETAEAFKFSVYVLATGLSVAAVIYTLIGQ